MKRKELTLVLQRANFSEFIQIPDSLLAPKPDWNASQGMAPQLSKATGRNKGPVNE